MKKIKLTESDLVRIVKKIITESENYERIIFNSQEIKGLSEMGFKFQNNNAVAILNLWKKDDGKTHKYELLKYFDYPKDVYGGWIVIKDGKRLFREPHDTCDIKLEDEIGWDSLGGGYKKSGNKPR